MKIYHSCCSFLLMMIVCGSCDQYKDILLTKSGVFASDPAAETVTPIINEASGIADSNLNPGKLWVHEDSGRPPKLYLLSHEGTVDKTIYLKGTVNRDWEDMALAGGDLFIANTGDNKRAYTSYSFYQFPEPASAVDTVKNIKIIRFKYPDGSHDAEAFLVDPQTRDIFIITKQDDPARIYKLAYPYNYTAINPVTLAGTLKYTGIVSAAYSPNGKEILLKTYTNIYYYARQSGQSTADALLKEFKTIPYQVEPQGEALSFEANNTGFFTLSEKGLTNTVKLYYYPRK